MIEAKEIPYKGISIHTPARGVTEYLQLQRCFQRYFNPHSRKGSDDKDIEAAQSTAISIHTPARGVTAIFANNHI